jgi:hypothetical protein
MGLNHHIFKSNIKSFFIVFNHHNVNNFTLSNTIFNEDSFCAKILIFISF